MDHPESPTLASVLAQVPDPRKRRGKRHVWTFLWTTICTAVLSEHRTPHAIAHWILLHAEELITRLQPARRQVPSESTVRRTLRHVDRTALEEPLTQFTQQLTPTAPSPPPSPPVSSPPAAPVPLRGQAVDGKAVRGAGMHGSRPRLASIVVEANTCEVTR